MVDVCIDKVVVDRYIPFIQGAIERVAREVVYLYPDEITPEAVRDADALMIRTRTRCNASLLEGSRCRFIATGTIGMDQFDAGYCRSRGIEITNAPGCNAPAVAQYVMAAIHRLRPGGARRIGIVGVGHVGGTVEKWARANGMEVMRCDPPRARREGGDGFHTLNDIAGTCDVITFHTPLTREGADATYHLADRAFFAAIRQKPVIINAARGGVVDEEAAMDALSAGTVDSLAIDCWEGEPRISRRTLDMAAIATPHIAGYSLQGKARATRMILDAFSRHFGLPRLAMQREIPTPIADSPSIADIAAQYDIMADDRMLRSAPDTFESLRDNYHYRNEP